MIKKHENGIISYKKQNEQEILVSVIVPFFNAEKYLVRCINSLLCQGFHELILVNDGSTDLSGEICEQFVEQDKRVKVFYQENKGVSVARNLGLEKATGNWVAFVDADDWVEPEWLEVLVINIKLYNSDLYTFGYNRVTDEKVVSTHVQKGDIKGNIDFISSGHHFAVWAYIFKRKIITDNSINFPVGLKFSEDQAFLLKYISKCDKIVLIEKPLYNYFNYPTSTVGTHISTLSWAMSNLIVANDFLQFCKQQNVPEAFYDYPVMRLYEAFLVYFSRLIRENKKGAQKQYRIEYRKSLQFYPGLKNQSTFRLAYYHLDLPEILKFRKQVKKMFTGNK